MLAIQITSMKPFMNQLLAGDLFDSFLLEEATITTANTIQIDGHINKEFYPPEERDTEHIPYELRPWNDMKGLCFHLMKGKNTPLFFKFVMHLKPETASSLLSRKDADFDPSQVRALVLNIRYDGSKAVLTTATAYTTFLLDKTADVLWDRALLKFLDTKGIAYEMLS